MLYQNQPGEIFFESEIDFKVRSSETILSRNEVTGQVFGVWQNWAFFFKEKFHPHSIECRIDNRFDKIVWVW